MHTKTLVPRQDFPSRQDYMIQDLECKKLGLRICCFGENLVNAIRRIRDGKCTRSFWIDALCIDQNDEADEKSTQIPLMRRIYQQAPKVLIYLGEDEDGSEKIPTILEGIIRAFDTIPKPAANEARQVSPRRKNRLLHSGR